MSEDQCDNHDTSPHDHQPEGEQPLKSVDPEFWLKFWDSKEGRDCNLQLAHECLIKYADKLLQGRENVKILVPLCGKTFDMKWLADKGHQIVGIEFSQEAIKQFFVLNNLDFTVSDIPAMDGKLFQSKDGKIKVYSGDIFRFNKNLENGFGAVWDSAAMHSLGKKDRKKYVDLIKSLSLPGCQYLVDDILPSCSDRICKTDMEAMFGPDYVIDDFGFTKTEYQFYKDWNTDGFIIFHIYEK